MKHRFNVMGVDRQGNATGCSIVAEDIIDVIKLCQNKGLNPHSISQAEQVHADAFIGFVTPFDNVQIKER